MARYAVMLLIFTVMSFAHAEQSYLSEDYVALPDILPTTYFIANESKISCVGNYRGVQYQGHELSQVLDPQGNKLAQVCTRFFKNLVMEGTGIIKDRGQGDFTVNWAGNGRFRVMTKCRFGEGVNGLCLLPFHTIAADLVAHKAGEIIFVPATQNLVLPDGSVHNGLFMVRDTGGAFRGIGPARVDLFVADQSDGDNVFSKAGLHHRKPISAFKLVGEARQQAIAFFKEKFGDLYLEGDLDSTGL